jgi:hypothetical protein
VVPYALCYATGTVQAYIDRLMLGHTLIHVYIAGAY